MPPERVIIVVGQTPPPFGGQAIMIANLLRAQLPGFRFVHVRMAFSAEMKDIGLFQLRKLIELGRVIANIWCARLHFRNAIFYYPPAGPRMIPFLRDVIILLTTRWLFPVSVFHFQASGLSALYPKLSYIPRLLFRAAYRRPTVAIRLSQEPPDDAALVEAKQTAIVPNGIDDQTLPSSDHPRAAHHSPPLVLFVGVLMRSKGFLDVIQCLGRLKAGGIAVRGQLIGQFESESLRSETYQLLNDLGLLDNITISGILIGEAKWEAYRGADIFCFPSYFESEACPLVLLEAMMFSLPVVTTRWRGIPSLVDDGQSGFLVNPQDIDDMTARLRLLLDDADLRNRMGGAGREKYMRDFTFERFEKNMKQAFELALSAA